MKKYLNIYTILGILGSLLILGGTFLPFTTGYSTYGEEIITPYLGINGILAIALVVVSIILILLEMSKLELIPTIVSGAFIGFDLYNELSITINDPSIGIGAVIMIVGILLLLIYSIMHRKDHNNFDRTQLKIEPIISEKDNIDVAISSLGIQQEEKYNYKAGQNLNIVTPNLPEELEEGQLFEEQNTIKLPDLDIKINKEPTPVVNPIPEEKVEEKEEIKEVKITTTIEPTTIEEPNWEQEITPKIEEIKITSLEGLNFDQELVEQDISSIKEEVDNPNIVDIDSIIKTL